MAVLDPSKFRKYLSVAKQFDNFSLLCQDVAPIDKRLTEKWVNSDNILSHSVRLDTIQENDHRKDVESFLDAEYGKGLRSVSFERLNYLENSFHTPLNLFAKIDITNREEVPGIIGFLLEIEPEEVIEGFNDFSIITSSRIGVEWMMLGPISFINASCKPNVAYVKVRKLMVCVPFREI